MNNKTEAVLIRGFSEMFVPICCCEVVPSKGTHAGVVRISVVIHFSNDVYLL